MNARDQFANLDTDPLSEMLDSAAAGNAPAPRKEPPANYRGPHFERCGKCGGSGMTRWGPCFRCKGKGGQEYKTSRAERTQRRAQVENRKRKLGDEAVEAFKAAHPDVWAWMDGNNYEFAVSLLGSLRRFGSLTDPQLAAARKSIEKLNAKKAEREERQANAPAIEVSAIAEAFDRAKAAGSKRPRLTVGAFKFSRAPDHGNNAGSIYVRQGATYMGKVTAGKFHAARECTPAQEAEILAMAADPKAAAIAHGRQFGTCSVCGRELSDPDSIAAGIGPQCASKMGW